MRVTEAHKSLYAGLFFALLSIFCLFVLNKHGIVVPTASFQAGSAAVSPRFFPDMICWCALVFSLGLMIEGALGMRRSARASGTSEKTEAEEQETEEKGSRALAVAYRIAGMGMLFVMYYATNFLGILISGFFFYLVFAALTGEQRPLRAVLGAFIITVVLYFFFVKIAYVPVPLGPLSNILY